MEDKKVCPYCKGKKFIGTGFKEIIENGHRTLYPYTEPCYCTINNTINKKFGMLTGVGDAHPSDAKLIRGWFNKGEIKNYLVFGKENVFLYAVKCYFLTNFLNKNYMLLEGGTIVEKYNTPSTDGEWLTPSHLNQYDLLVLLFTTSANYPTLKECILEVIKNRFRLGVPTWVYLNKPDDLKGCNEYSQKLETYFEEYKRVSIGNGSNLKGFNPINKKSLTQNNIIKVQDMAAKA
jgi:hypothetical protein